ncbi:MAG: single-stranded-DNA-specific exonuclease RecJ [Clostridia bacterium]
MNLKSWKIKNFDKDFVVQMIDKYSLNNVLAILLAQRTNNCEEEMANFLNDDLYEESPFDILDMDKAVSRIITAVENFEKIAIFGDYDADGITATSILYEYFQFLGANVIFYIPKRETEGYGMNMAAVDYLHELETKLIVTVDNGIAAIKEIDYANTLGIDIVVTDHHKVQGEIPNACAVVNPHRQDCPSSFKDYCGAGIALKLVQALELEMGETDGSFEEFASFATIGTIADVVPLVGENRRIVKKGLEQLAETEKLGLRELIDACLVKELNSTSLAFSVIPRINATGRIDSASKAVNLLCTENENDAKSLCKDVCNDNIIRRDIESNILEQAIFMIEKDENIKNARVIVLAGKDWHGGVVGIVASRICEKYSKPCIILTIEDDKTKGSGRSVGGFNLFDAISYTKDILERFGGHLMACGLSLKTENISLFREKINEYAKINYDIMPSDELVIDLKIRPSALTIDVVEQLKVLEPFGEGNNTPVFGLFAMRLEAITALGANKNHLRLQVSRGDTKINIMQFFCRREEFLYKVGTELDFAVTLSINEYNGNTSLSIISKAIKPHRLNMDLQIYSHNIYQKYKRNEFLTREEITEIMPSREDFATIYRFINYGENRDFTYLQILEELPPVKISIGKLMLALDALFECRLIVINGEDIMNIEIVKSKEKVDILSCGAMRKLRGLLKE